MEPGFIGFGQVLLKKRNDVLVNFNAPPATSRLGLISAGNAPWDGVSTGFFSGSSLGTIYAANAASTFTGHLIGLETGGVRVFDVDYTGSIFTNNNLWVTNNINIKDTYHVISTALGQPLTVNTYHGTVMTQNSGGTSPCVEIQGLSSGQTTLIVKAASGQSVDIQQWKDNLSNVLLSINSSGQFFKSTITDGQLLIGQSSDHTLGLATLTAGTNIVITNSGHSISIASIAGGSVAAASDYIAALYMFT